MESASVASKSSHALTRAAFDQMLACLDPERERAAEKYEEVRQGLITFFSFRGAADPDERADETINRVARRVHEGVEIFAANPASYFYAVAKFVWRETAATAAALTPLSEQNYVTPSPQASPMELLLQAEQERDEAQRLAHLKQCLGKLPPEDQELIVLYYEGSGAAKIARRQMLAQRYRVSPESLRKRASRLRAKLGAYLHQHTAS